jgi:hypothetical protein
MKYFSFLLMLFLLLSTTSCNNQNQQSKLEVNQRVIYCQRGCFEAKLISLPDKTNNVTISMVQSRPAGLESIKTVVPAKKIFPVLPSPAKEDINQGDYVFVGLPRNETNLTVMHWIRTKVKEKNSDGTLNLEVQETYPDSNGFYPLSKEQLKIDLDRNNINLSSYYIYPEYTVVLQKEEFDESISN